MRVGIAGLGRMGAHMARNLARAGHDVTLWNRSRDKAEALAAEIGCAIAATPRALTDATQAVVTMLADDVASQVVHAAPDGLFSDMPIAMPKIQPLNLTTSPTSLMSINLTL